MYFGTKDSQERLRLSESLAEMESKFIVLTPTTLAKEREKFEINDCFKEEMKKADQLKITVEIASFDSLKELDRLVIQEKIKHICLVFGSYYFNGFPKPIRELALAINEKWQKAGIGEIRIINAFPSSANFYCFFKDDQIFSVLMGSPCLTFLTDNEPTRKYQFETAVWTKNEKILKTYLSHIDQLCTDKFSQNIAILEEQQRLFDENTLLKQEAVFRISSKVFKSKKKLC